MYPLRCSIDISICITEIMKHRFKGFCTPTGVTAIFLETILMTGKLESRAIVGPPP